MTDAERKIAMDSSGFVVLAEKCLLSFRKSAIILLIILLATVSTAMKNHALLSPEKPQELCLPSAMK